MAKKAAVDDFIDVVLPIETRQKDGLKNRLSLIVNDHNGYVRLISLSLLFVQNELDAY